MLDKSTKFGMRLPLGPLVNVSLGAIRDCQKIIFWGPFREGVPSEIAQSISRPLDMLASWSWCLWDETEKLKNSSRPFRDRDYNPALFIKWQWSHPMFRIRDNHLQRVFESKKPSCRYDSRQYCLTADFSN